MYKRHIALIGIAGLLSASSSLGSAFAQIPIIDTPPHLEGCTPKVLQFRLGGPTYMLSETGAVVYKQGPEILSQDVTIQAAPGENIQAIYYGGHDDYELPHEGTMSVVNGSGTITNTYTFSTAVNGSDMNAFVPLPDQSTHAVRFVAGTKLSSHEWFGAYFCIPREESSSSSSQQSSESSQSSSSSSVSSSSSSACSQHSSSHGHEDDHHHGNDNDHHDDHDSHGHLYKLGQKIKSVLQHLRPGGR